MILLHWIFALWQAVSATGTIEGIVINAGGVVQQPLQNARLELSGPGGSRLVRSDSMGQFAFSGLAPGRYRIKVTRDGFIRQSSPAIAVTRGQNINDIVFDLQPAPTVYGIVLDGDFAANGEPKANALVQALRMGYGPRGGRVLTAIAATLTDDKGRYRLYWLDPGEYKIGVQSAGSTSAGVSAAETTMRSDLVRAGIIVVPTYYSGVTDPNEAQRVRLKTGREMDLGEFRLSPPQRTLSVTGSVISAVTGKPLSVPSTVTLTLAGTVDNKFRFQGETVYNKCTGLYEGPCSPPPSDNEGFMIRGVPNGLYFAVAQAVSGESGVALVDARKYLDLERLVKNAQILVSPPVQVSGRVAVDSTTRLDLTTTELTLTAVEPVIPSPAAVALQTDGTFVVASMRTGAYLVNISGLPDDAYMKAAHAGKIDVLENPLEVRYGSSEPLEILLSPDGGQLNGISVDRGGRPIAGGDVVLVPDPKLRHRVDQYRTQTSDRNGGFIFRGIEPGDYRLFAWESLEPNAYLNADFMRDYESLGIPVRIRPGRNGAVQVVAIPAD